MASRTDDSGTSEKALLSFILNPDDDDDDASRTQHPRSSHTLPPAQQKSSSKSAKGVRKKRQRSCICQTCGHGFYTNSDLHKHVSAVHLLLRPFECSMCNKKFGEKSNATKQGVHERQKNATCDQCNKVFAFRDGLVRHVRLVHENVRNFPRRRPGCGQSLKQKVHLKRHEEVHSRGGDGRGKYRPS